MSSIISTVILFDIFSNNQIFDERVFRTWNSMSVATIQKGEYGAAAEALQKALSIARDLGERRLELTAFNNLALLKQYLGELEESIEYQLMVAKGAYEIGEKKLEATAYYNVGILYKKLNNYSEAAKALERSYRASVELGLRRHISGCLSALGAVYLEQKEYGKAERTIREALKGSSGLQDKLQTGQAHNDLARVLFSTDQLVAAIDEASSALLMGKSINSLPILQESSELLSSIYEKQGEPGRALDYYRSYHEYSLQVMNEEAKRNVKSIESDFFRSQA